MEKIKKKKHIHINFPDYEHETNHNNESTDTIVYRNVTPRPANRPCPWLQRYRPQVTDDPRSRSDLATSGFHIRRHITKHLARKRFATDADAK